MFSLIITIISIALVVGITAAMLFYGGDQGEARTQVAAVKLHQQGEQLTAAVTLFNSEHARNPNNMQELLNGGYLTSVPVAIYSIVPAAVATEMAEWVMPVDGAAVFVFGRNVSRDVCAAFNEKGSIARKGIYRELYTNLKAQCFGGIEDELTVVVARTQEDLQRAYAAAGNSAPISDNGEAWLLAPTDSVTPGNGGNPVNPDDEDGNEVVEPVEPPEESQLGSFYIANSWALAAPVDTADFGAMAKGGGGGLWTLAIVNNGEVPVEDINASLFLMNGFYVDWNTCNGDLNPGSSCQVHLRADVANEFNYNDTLYVTAANAEAKYVNLLSRVTDVIPGFSPRISISERLGKGEPATLSIYIAGQERVYAGAMEIATDIPGATFPNGNTCEGWTQSYCYVTMYLPAVEGVYIGNVTVQSQYTGRNNIIQARYSVY